MAEYKELKQKQLDEIKELETEISKVRQEQAMLINGLRSDFFQEKSDHKRTTEQRIAKIVKVANREAKGIFTLNFHIRKRKQLSKNSTRQPSSNIRGLSIPTINLN